MPNIADAPTIHPGADPASKVMGAISVIFARQASYYRESCFRNCTKLWWI